VVKVSAHLKLLPAFNLLDLDPNDVEALISALTFYTMHAKDAPKEKAKRSKEILHALEQSDSEAFSAVREQAGKLTLHTKDRVL